MSLEIQYPKLNDKILEARNEGYSDDEISGYINGKIQTARDEGYSDSEVAEYLGTPQEPTTEAPPLNGGTQPNIPFQQEHPDLWAAGQAAKQTAIDVAEPTWDTAKQIGQLYPELLSGYAPVEATAAIATGWPMGGLAYLAGLGAEGLTKLSPALKKHIDPETLQRGIEALAYQPFTEKGQILTEKLAHLYETVVRKPGEVAGEWTWKKVLDVTGNPDIAALAGALANVSPDTLIFGKHLVSTAKKAIKPKAKTTVAQDLVTAEKGIKEAVKTEEKAGFKESVKRTEGEPLKELGEKEKAVSKEVVEDTVKKAVYGEREGKVIKPEIEKTHPKYSKEQLEFQEALQTAGHQRTAEQVALLNKAKREGKLELKEIKETGEIQLVEKKGEKVKEPKQSPEQIAKELDIQYDGALVKEHPEGVHQFTVTKGENKGVHAYLKPEEITPERVRSELNASIKKHKAEAKPEIKKPLISKTEPKLKQEKPTKAKEVVEKIIGKLEKQPYEMRKSEFIPREDTIMPDSEAYPVGTKRLGKEGYIDELVEVPIRNITLQEANTVNRAKVEEYKSKRANVRPVLFREKDGKLVVDDGHHRIIADRDLGKKTTLAWVRDATDYPRSATHKYQTKQAIAEGKIESHPDYPELGKSKRQAYVEKKEGGAKTPLKELESKWEASNVKLYIHENKQGAIVLSRVEIPKEQRGAGIGTEVMNDIINYADTNGKKIALTPSKDFGATSVGRLKKFYKQFDFVENKGKNKDYEFKETMLRNPKPTLKKRVEKHKEGKEPTPKYKPIPRSLTVFAEKANQYPTSESFVKAVNKAIAENDVKFLGKNTLNKLFDEFHGLKAFYESATKERPRPTAGIEATSKDIAGYERIITKKGATFEGVQKSLLGEEDKVVFKDKQGNEHYLYLNEFSEQAVNKELGIKEKLPTQQMGFGFGKEPKTWIEWIKSKGGVDLKFEKGEADFLSGKESGIVGVLKKDDPKALSFDKLRELAEGEGRIPKGFTTEEFKDLLKEDIRRMREGEERIFGKFEDMEKAWEKELNEYFSGKGLAEDIKVLFGDKERGSFSLRDLTPEQLEARARLLENTRKLYDEFKQKGLDKTKTFRQFLEDSGFNQKQARRMLYTLRHEEKEKVEVKPKKEVAPEGEKLGEITPEKAGFKEMPEIKPDIIDTKGMSPYQKKNVAWHPKSFEWSKEGLLNILRRTYTKFVMAEYPVARLARKSKDKVATERIENQIRRIRGKGGISEEIIAGKGPLDSGLSGWKYEKWDNLKDILTELKTKEEYTDYETLRIAERDMALAEHRPDIKGTDYIASQKEVMRLEKKWDKPQMDKFREISSNHREFERKAILEPLVDIGWMSKKVYDNIVSRPESEYYASFGRELENVERHIMGGKDPIKRIKGTEKELKKVPTTESTIANVYKTVKLVETLRLNKEVAELRKLTPDLEKEIYEVSPNYIPVKQVLEAEIDPVMREGLTEITKSLGASVETLKKLRGRRLGEFRQYLDTMGVADRKAGEIALKFATTEKTFSHELGHLIDSKYDLQSLLIKGKGGKYPEMKRELRKVADQRAGKGDVSPHYRKYLRKREEQVAEFVNRYLNNPDQARELAPTATAKLEELFKSKKELNKLLELKPSGSASLAKLPDVVFAKSPIPPKGTIVTAENGMKHYWHVPEDVKNALDYYSPREMNTVLQLMSYPTRTLRAGATLTFEFIVRNPARDQFSAMTYAKHGYVPIADFAKGVFHLLKKGELYDEYKASGAEQAYFVSLDRTALNLTAKDILKHRKWGFKTYNPIEGLRILSEYMEKGTRLGAFAKARKKGAPIPEAMAEARELTLDFGRIGQERAMNQLVAFWNANIQGVDKLARSLFSKETGGRTLRRLTMGITIPSIALWFANKDNKRYQELPEWQKNLFWIYPVGEAGPIIRYPKPFELGIIFGSLPERILDYIYMNDPKELDSIWKAMADGASPGLIPTAMLPAIENETNWKFFLDRQLESERLKQLPEGMRANRYTSDVVSKFGKATDISPIKIENWIRSWTGGLGKYALNIADLAVKDDMPEVTKNWYESAPFIKGFIAREPIGSQSESVNEFYENLEKFTQAERGFKVLRDSGKIEDARKFRDEYKTEISHARKAKRIAKEMSELRNKKEKIIDNKSLSDERKKKRIKMIDNKITDKAILFNKQYKESKSK